MVVVVVVVVVVRNLLCDSVLVGLATIAGVG